MAKEELKIVITADSKDAVNATKDVGNAVNNMSNFIKGLGIGAGALIVARKGFEMLTSAIRGTIDFLKSSVEEAANAELQLTKLNTALKSTGNFTNETTKELQDYAAALQQSTMYEDDSIVSVEAMLATFKLSKDEIKVATQAVLDLAAATGQDLQSAAILMGKAMVGNTGMLARYGIMVDETKLKNEGWKAVIDEINIEFGGQAQAQAETYTGKIAQMKNMFSDIKETIGGAFIPVLTDLFGVFTKGQEVINPMTGEIVKLNSPMQELAGIVGSAAEGIRGFIEQNWGGLKDKIGDVWGKLSSFIEALTKAEWSRFGSSISELGNAFGFLLGGADSGLTGVDQKAQNFVDSLTRLMESISFAVMSFRIFWDVIIVVGQALQWVISGITAFIYAVKGDIVMANEIMIGANKAVGDSAGKLADDVKKMGEIIEKSQSSAANVVNTTVTPAMIGARNSAAEYAAAVRNIPTEWTTHLYQVTHYLQEGYSPGIANIINKSNASGGFSRSLHFADDLGLPVLKGEALIPESITKAIKESRGSFAGIDIGKSSAPTINITVTGNNISNEADENRLADKVGRVIINNLRLQGAQI
ncbi:MAG: hypothetical protein ACYCXQ_01015 [Candidatus Humimicrobiaceae bacterium]